jgi:predicted O-methyltransferase YrrM
MNALKLKLYKTDPFHGFNKDPDSFDRSGWGLHAIFGYLIPKLLPNIIIEIGSWKGNSAIHMAEIATHHQLNTEIVCVDTFTGSPEHWIKTDSTQTAGVHEFSDWYDSLKVVRGRPTLFEIFMNNCVCANVSERITPFPVSSDNAFYVLDRLNVRAELIYIDAGHEYESASRDLNKFINLLADRGVLVMDDYAGWPGVTRAVHEFVYKNPDYYFVAEFGKAILTKNVDLKLATKIVALA